MYIYIYTHTHTHTYIYIYLSTHIYIYMYVYLVICMYMCMCMYIYIYIYICVCVCIHACMRMYKHTLVYLHNVGIYPLRLTLSACNHQRIGHRVVFFSFSKARALLSVCGRCAPPSSVLKCVREVFVWGFGVLFLSCMCECRCWGCCSLFRCVCVCVTCWSFFIGDPGVHARPQASGGGRGRGCVWDRQASRRGRRGSSAGNPEVCV